MHLTINKKLREKLKYMLYSSPKSLVVILGVEGESLVRREKLKYMLYSSPKSLVVILGVEGESLVSLPIINRGNPVVAVVDPTV